MQQFILKREAWFAAAGAVVIAAVTMIILEIQHPSLAFSYRDGVDDIGLINYVRQTGFSFNIPFFNLQMLGGFYALNHWLSPSMWPAALFGTSQPVLDACYGLSAVELYLSTYLLSRILGSTQVTAVLGGLLLPFVILPLVWPTGPFNLLTFCTIFGDLIVLNNIALIGMAKILAPDRPYGAGYVLLALAALWITLLTPLATVLVVPFDLAVYVALSMRLAGTGDFWARQRPTLMLLALMLALLGPYLFGLFANTSSAVFGTELRGDTFPDPWLLVPAPFRNWESAFFVLSILLIFFAAHKWTRGPKSDFSLTFLRIAGLFGTVALLMSLIFAFIAKGSGTFPRPSYFEVPAWPYYALFIAFLVGTAWDGIFESRLLMPYRTSRSFLLLAAFVIFAGIMAVAAPQKYESSVMPYRPANDGITRFLQTNLVEPDGSYAGQVATFAGGADNVGDVLAYDRKTELSVGNAHRGETLRYFGIRTLDEYNSTIGPAKYLLLTRFFARPTDLQSRAMVVFSNINQPALAALGVRYVVTDHVLPSPAVFRLKQDVPGTGAHFVYELANVNLGTYAPVSTHVEKPLEQQLRAILEPKFDFRQSVVTEDALPPLRPAQSKLFAEAGRYRVFARSGKMSLLVLPIAYSNCLRWKNLGQSAPPRLLRVDFALTGVLFEQSVDGAIEPVESPFVNPFCGIADWLKMRELKKRHDSMWPSKQMAVAR